MFTNKHKYVIDKRTAVRTAPAKCDRGKHGMEKSRNTSSMKYSEEKTCTCTTSKKFASQCQIHDWTRISVCIAHMYVTIAIDVTRSVICLSVCW